MTEYEELLKQIESACSDRLKPIFKCFYQNLEKTVEEDNKNLNIGLNLFFGNFEDINNIENNDKWKDKFKKSIKEKYETAKQDKNGDSKFKLKDPSTETLNALTTDDFLKEAKHKWLIIKNLLDQYFNNLNLPIDKTLIYEAPPYLLSIIDGKINFEAEFIFDKKCSSPYVNAIRNCFNENKKDINQILSEKNVGFFDVIPIPIPINSDLREKWATDTKFIIDGKRIFVHFFEWALEIYLFKLNGKFEKKHKIAIGIPLKNAVTIYEHAHMYENWPGYELDNNFCAAHIFDAANPKKVGLWVQPYKNCIIGSSNTPSGDLMKLAFEITSS